MLAENADYSCLLMSGMAKVTCPLIVAESALRFSFGDRVMVEIKIWCVNMAGKRRGIRSFLDCLPGYKASQSITAE